MGKKLRLNMTDLSTKIEDNLAEWAILGDRGLVFCNKSAQLPPTSHPFDKHDQFVVAPAHLSGMPLTSFEHLSVGENFSLADRMMEEM